MRTDQFVGLSSKARKWLDENAKKDDFILYKNGKLLKKWSEPRCEQHKTWKGAFGDQVPLQKYSLGGGLFGFEVVQAEPWASWLVVFTCLEAEGKEIRKTRWSNKEMEEYL